MKRFLTLVLLLCLVVDGLLAQKKAENAIQPYFAIMSGYTAISFGRIFPLNFEYQYRYKKIGIGVGFTSEYAKYSYGSLKHLYEVGTIAQSNSAAYNLAYQAKQQWINLAPSLLGYYYLGKKKKWEGFFKTGIVANYNAWYAYKGFEYRLGSEGKVVDKGPILVETTINSIDLQSINWIIGGGVQYTLNRKTALRMTSEIQWARGVSILGGVVFKL